MKINRNVSGKENRRYSAEELVAIAEDAQERHAPEWVSRSLLAQAQQHFFPFIHGGS